MHNFSTKLKNFHKPHGCCFDLKLKMHKLLTVKLFGNQCKKYHPILNPKDLHLSMSMVYFSISFAVTTSCPLNILKCMITHLYQALTLLKKCQTIMKYWPLIAMVTTGCYFYAIDLNLASNKGYLICQSSPRLEPSLIYWDMGHQDP